MCGTGSPRWCGSPTEEGATVLLAGSRSSVKSVAVESSGLKRGVLEWFELLEEVLLEESLQFIEFG